MNFPLISGALDDMAELTSGMAPEFERMCRIYKSDARWRVPGQSAAIRVKELRQSILSLDDTGVSSIIQHWRAACFRKQAALWLLS